jgi:hypothetical protein
MPVATERAEREFQFLMTHSATVSLIAIRSLSNLRSLHCAWPCTILVQARLAA